MANSTTSIPLISASQSAKEVTANGLFTAASPAMLYGRDPVNTSALTWGYLEGNLMIDGVPTFIAAGTVALTASATNYIEADPATGAVSVNTSAFTSGATQLYQVVTGASTVTSYTDKRTAAVGGGGSSGFTQEDADLLYEPIGEAADTMATHLVDVDPHPEYDMGAQITAATAKTTPVDADMLGISDSAASNVLKKLSWANIKATLKAYFDTLYAPIGGGGGSVAGSDKQVQFNDGGSMGAEADLAYDKTTNALSIGSLATPGIVQGGAPATATSSGAALAVKGGAAGATSGAGGAVSVSGTDATGTDTAGGAASLTAGNSTGNAKGGNANITAGTAGATGTGGDVVITAGAGTSNNSGGKITLTGSKGSAVDILGGADASSGTGNGGAVNVKGGTSRGSGVSGGSALLAGGDGVTASGHGGTATVRGGDAGGATSNGGNVTIRGGNSQSPAFPSSSATPGTVTVLGGSASLGGTNNTASGGAVTVQGGTAGAGGGDGGAVTVQGGAPQAGNGGAVSVLGAAGVGTNKNGGKITVKGGAATGTGTPGSVELGTPSLATTAIGGFPCIPTCAGAPTGTPAGISTGLAPMVLDTTNSRLYFNVGGTWKYAALT